MATFLSLEQSVKVRRLNLFYSQNINYFVSTFILNISHQI